MKQFLTKLTLPFLATLLITSPALQADPTPCGVNDYCINFKLENVGIKPPRVNVELYTHMESRTIFGPYSRDFTNHRDDNSFTSGYWFGGDVTQYHISDFIYAIKTINGIAIENCGINRKLIDKGAVDTIRIWREGDQYRCEIIRGS